MDHSEQPPAGPAPDLPTAQAEAALDVERTLLRHIDQNTELGQYYRRHLKLIEQELAEQVLGKLKKWAALAGAVFVVGGIATWSGIRAEIVAAGATLAADENVKKNVATNATAEISKLKEPVEAEANAALEAIRHDRERAKAVLTQDLRELKVRVGQLEEMIEYLPHLPPRQYRRDPYDDQRTP